MGLSGLTSFGLRVRQQQKTQDLLAQKGRRRPKAVLQTIVAVPSIMANPALAYEFLGVIQPLESRTKAPAIMPFVCETLLVRDANFKNSANILALDYDNECGIVQ